MTWTKPDTPLRRGWTTGTCAAGASRAAFAALIGGEFPDPVEVLLPGGQRPQFALAQAERGVDFARAAIVKDAGDDPDVTHGATIIATVRRGAPGAGVIFRAGAGVGVVTRPGLPLAPGEPAINPSPRAIIRANLGEIAAHYGVAADVEVEISIPDGERLAARTMNGRLGVIGGLSILGTTGVVIPYSCSAWIDSIHRGIDVARAAGLNHVAGATGATSEAGVQKLYGLSDQALIDMGDFVGGMIKYLRRRPVARVSIAAGFAKMTKLAQGLLDLHSRRGEVDLPALAARAQAAGASVGLAEKIGAANSALHALELAQADGLDLPALIVGAAWPIAAAAFRGAPAALELVVFARDGALLARSGFRDCAGIARPAAGEGRVAD